MKKLAYLLLMAFFFPLIAFSANYYSAPNQQSPNERNLPESFNLKKAYPDGNIPAINDNYYGFDAKAKNKLQTGNGNVDFFLVDTITDARRGEFYDQTAFTYEPISKTYVMIQGKRGSDAQGNYVSRMYIYTSQDGGKNWAKRVVGATGANPIPLGEIFLNPSIAVLNPNNATNPNQLYYLVFAARYIKGVPPQDTNTYWYKGGGLIYVDPTASTDGDYLSEIGPGGHNPGNGYQWIFPQVLGVGNTFYYWERLSPISDSYQYGQYGLGKINVVSGENSSDIPTEFEAGNWIQPAQKTSTFNTTMQFDYDAAGTLYAGVINRIYDPTKHNNPHVEGDSIVVPYVLTSNDQGKTWGTTYSMPQSVWDNYAVAHGFTTLFAWEIYSSFDFIVRGTNKWSFAVQCLFTDPDPANPGYVFYKGWMIAEITYDNGTWAIHDINGDDPVLQKYNYTWYTPWGSEVAANRRYVPYLLNDTSQAGALSRPVDYIMANPRGFEIQMARSADYNNYVIKYLELTDTIPTPLQLLNSNVLFSPAQNSTLASTDINIAVRTKESSTWNVTDITANDPQKLFDIGTWIPKIVDIESIPIMVYKNNVFQNPANNSGYSRDALRAAAYNAVPQISQYFFDEFNNTEVWCGLINGTDPQPLQQPDKSHIPTKVVSQENDVFSISDIYPNPAKEGSKLNFNLMQRSDITISISDETGKSIQTVFSGTLEEGVHSQDFSTSNLSAGAYYVTIKAGNFVESRLLNVVR